MNPGWSYILTAIGLFGMWLAGRKDWRGWLIGLSAQGVWLTYAVATQQWGFIVSAFAYGWVYALNIWRMRQDDSSLRKDGRHDRLDDSSIRHRNPELKKRRRNRRSS